MEKFYIDTQVYFEEKIDEIIESLKSKKYFFITDPMMVKIGLSKKIEDIFIKNKIEYEIFSGVEVNPTLESIKKALERVMEFSPERMIVLGGGSSLDSAKAVSYFMYKSGKEIPIIAIPTTCGTGSEVTSYAVITDTIKNIKIPIKDDVMTPKIAVLDPDFTETLPKSVVADGGMDAMTHAIESYTSKNANIFTQILSMYAIKSIFKNILKMYENIQNNDVRLEMAKAACIAGVAFEKAGLGINHSIAHSIGGKFHKAHGRSNAVILPYVIRFNSSDEMTAKKYFEISKELGLPSSNITEGAESLAIAMEILNEKLGIEKRVRDLKIDENEYRDSILEMTKGAIDDICTAGNMKNVTFNEMKKMFEIVY